MTLKDINRTNKEPVSKEKKQHAKEIKREIRKKTAGYIIAGLALVGGLAWNDAISALIELYFPANSNGVLAKIIYAVFVTVLVAVASYYITKFLSEDEDKKELK
ncbi:MAG: DUF5654 family protein [Candidatus Spechtbacteria bacterium]|nr:DUF5654 family protein [Candidatus Spechtbacteria bacterium]